MAVVKIAPALMLALTVATPALASPAITAPLTGRWAGDRLDLVATASGARLALDCAAGHIDAPISPDKTGHFSASGSFNAWQPGPQRADEPVPDAAARFTGTISGDRMTLHIQRAGIEPQTYQLVRGATSKPVRCL